MKSSEGALKPYSQYSAIDLPWLQQVPAHWSVKRGKALFQCIDERSSSGREELLTVSSVNGVVRRSTANVTMFKAESYEGYKLCWPDDLVINSLWAWAGGLGVSRYHGIVSSAYGVYRLREGSGNSPAFMHSLVRSAPFQWELQVRSKGIWTSRLQLTDQSFLSAPFPVPPPDEQAAIVRFLGHLDRRVHRYIRAKKELLKLLDEQKQVIIHQAVTGKIDVRTGSPHRTYKSTNIEWLGEVPAHWDIRRIRRCLKNVVSGIWGEEPTEANADDHITCLRVADFDVVNLDVSTRKLTTRAIPPSAQAPRLLRSGDILIEKSGGGDAQPVGRVVLFDLDTPAVTSNFVSRLRVREGVVRPRFLLYVLALLQSRRVNVPSIKQTTGIQNLDEYEYFSMPVGLPNLDEQDAVVAWIDDNVAELRTTADRERQAIELLLEYQRRLAADAVTGKIDVREAAADLHDEVEDQRQLEDESPVDDDSEAAEVVLEEAEA